ncbi:MAG: c-type cytochrome [Proteobacteria bacterium]|nr:c-type cytochrome [Pseudomonadota bacterium]
MKTVFRYRKQMGLLTGAVVAIFFSQVILAADYPDAGNLVYGAKVWAENCSRCHNARDPKDLRDDQWITSVFHMRVRAGLTGQQARDVLTFLQQSNETIKREVTGMTMPDDSSVSTMSGDDIYNQTCIACHGANGKGTVPGSPDFTRIDGVLSQGYNVLFQHIKHGFQSAGSLMAMPSKGGNANLNDADLRGVLDYLQSQFGK